MRASMPMNLERSEFPKGERAKLNSPSVSFALHRSRKADGIHYARNGSILPPVVSGALSSSVPSRSSFVLLNRRAFAVLARLSSRLRSWKCCSPRPSLFSAAFRPESFGSETGILDLDAKKDGERVHRLPSCVMVKILE